MMDRICKLTGTTFTIHPDEEAFLEKLSFRFGSTVIHPPPPVYSPDVRNQLRCAHRNERCFHKRRSDFSGKGIISLYSEQVPWGESYKVYSQEEWKSDHWDPLNYGREFDFTKPFFEQFAALQKDVPRMALIALGNENSDYTTGTGYCRNCYLINSSENCEDCYYSKLLQQCKDSVDCSYLYDSELCYECFSVYHSYNCQYLSFSENCTDCLHSSNLKSCKHCCLCTNLVNKEYHFMNQPLSKEEYEQRVSQFLGDHERTEKMKQLHQDAMSKMIRKYSNIVNCENCSGDYVEGSRNCLDCYDVNESEDCRYVYVGVNVKDNYDCSNMYLKPELCYDTLGTINVHTAAYCLFIFDSQRMLYSDYCFNCSDCFACSGLSHKQYCVFNKQYTKEEYETLVPKIIEHMQSTGEWGLFFPPQYAPFGYNETLAHEYYPLTKEQALKLGFLWHEDEASTLQAQSYQVPNSIKEVDDSITQQVLACAVTGKNYRIVPQELDFYRKQNIPIPRKCPDQRHVERMELRNPRRLWQRDCMKCGQTMQTTFAPNRTEKIYCEECYLQEVY